ncbi:hypothetical protein GCM10009122_21060 [Fulvivirga kasyanovii]|uniref:TonB-dependent receptor plug domain-containing protein n=1 Tax=Fulvivirga kasyanovii TaxID=396812 RepID=A0ABW9RY35_9BACT|nr:hypothetical protein [Fulvivirga kasyanovii]MTI27920.1 hypothetical protein [Fulvivirga kasyanovii]
MLKVLLSCIFISHSLQLCAYNQYLHLVADSHFYVSGDVVKVGVICREVGTGKLVEDEILIRLQLVGPGGNVIEEKRIITDSLNKSAELILSPELVSGNYTVFAHDESGEVHSGRVDIEVYGEDYEYSLTSEKLEIKFKTETGTGVLLFGVENHITMHVQDVSGDGIPISGKIYDETYSEVTDVSTDNYGVGEFTLVPGKEHYTMRFVYQGELKEVKLPAVSSIGAIIDIKENDNRFILQIKSSRGSSPHSTKATLEEFLNDSLISTVELDLASNVKVMGSLPSKASGYRATYILKDSVGRVLAKKEIVKDLADTVDIKLTEVGERSQLIRASINSSIRQVYDNSLVIVKVFDKNLGSYPKSGMALNDKFCETPKIRLDVLTEDPASRISVYNLEEYYAKEAYYGRKGSIIEWLKEKEGDGTIWPVQFAEDGTILGEIDAILNYECSYSYEDNNEPLSGNYNSMIALSRKRLLVQKVYASDEQRIPRQESKFVVPDYSIQLADYQTLPTVEETLKAIVPKCRVVKRKGRKELRLVPKESSHRYKEKPLILINGIPTFEIKYLLEFDVSDIAKIHLYNSPASEARYGMFGKHGVILIELKSDVVNPLQSLRDHFTKIRGIDNTEPKTLSRLIDEAPDLRCTIFWNPNLRINDAGEAAFEFYKSDVEGDYLVYVEIIATDGKIYKARKEFSISRP